MIKCLINSLNKNTSALVILFFGLISSNLSNKSIANGFEYLITLLIELFYFV